MNEVQHEEHGVHRTNWLRAAVLGANDGIVSTASLILGVASLSHEQIVLTGFAGLVAGSLSMAAGEYVSVSSQSDIEEADLERERLAIANNRKAEHKELAAIYVERGLTKELATQVAEQLMAHDAIGSHARDELGITDITAAKPLQAALASAISFASGAALPLLTAALLAPVDLRIGVPVASLVTLALLGAWSAHAGRASMGRAVFRVTFWGAAAMALTYGVGHLFGTPAA